MIPAPFGPIIAHLWQSTIFAAAAVLLSLALRHTQARVRYWLWLTASAKFLVPFSWLIAVGRLLPWRSSATLLSSILLSSVSAANAPPRGLSGFSSILWMVWGCGFGVVVIGWIREWLRIRSIARSGLPTPLEFPIPVLATAVSLEPGVFGIFHPVLLLPEGVTKRLTPAQLKCVLEHERSHLRHRDNLTAALHLLVESAFWFHPLVWWLGGRLMEERERACDEEVLRHGIEAQSYAQALLRVCELYLDSPLSCVSGITGPTLKKRLEHIMENRVAYRLKTWNKALLTAAAVVAIVAPIFAGTTPPLSAQSSPATGAYQAGKDGVSYPKCAYCPDPKYSNEALKARFEGFVVLRAVITAKGRATNIQVVNSPGYGLDKQAVNVLKTWRFKPATGPNGNAVDVQVPIQVEFRLTPKKN